MVDDVLEPGVYALPTDSKARKGIPIVRGCLDYFPAALAAVAELSRKGNEKHNPGEELHHARGKSTDHADCILRHLMDRGTVDPEDQIRHSVKVAWRALALLQEELEAAGAPLARGARLPETVSSKGFTDSGVGGGHESKIYRTVSGVPIDKADQCKGNVCPHPLPCPGYVFNGIGNVRSPAAVCACDESNCVSCGASRQR